MLISGHLQTDEILTSHYRVAQGLWFHLENGEKFISRNMQAQLKGHVQECPLDFFAEIEHGQTSSKFHMPICIYL